MAACAADKGSGTGAAAADSPIVAEAQANLDQYYANNTADFKLDPVSDPHILDGKTIMYLSAGLSSPDGTAGLEALKEAQKTLGFDFVTYDGQFTSSKYQDGMRQAVAQGVDALMLYGVDCAGNEAALREVHEAGIKIIGLASVDCDEADPSAPRMFDAQPLYPLQDGTGGRTKAKYASQGAAQADYLIAKLEGNVKVVQFDVPDFAVTAALGQGFRDRLKECSSCDLLEDIDIGVADFGPGLQQKAEQALLKHPDANALSINYDDLVTLGLGSAVASSGRNNDILAIAGNGYEAAMDIIREDKGLDAGYGLNPVWDHYALIDTTMRVLAGQEPAINGIPLIIYDKDHNIPASGAFEPGTDYKSVFEKAWGVS